ncbi:glycosyltransferase family 4 protein [Hymenobacter rubripertinctus]|uniref:Glycosyltransferase n=1 Tax=Hymenobacter rubripertinctus TaxID=2029981 RepID=A0A418QWE3_9BACT|nr:glycosyltransferase family 4 protein [Hymenobacter rubripertinctus]RIY09519.1 glycosyltransferase [Hymenobacter rubripertinctus]
MTSQLPARIGFLTSTDPLDRRSWSGVHYSIFRAAERIFGPVTALGPAPMVWPLRIGNKLNHYLITPLTGKRYHHSWSVMLARLYARQFGQRLARQSFDLLLAPASFTEIAYLHTTIPIVYIEDSTLHQLIDFYPGLTGLLEISKRELNHIEKRALNKATLICYSSQWAAQSAIRDYGADPAKVVVIPFGANYPSPPQPAEIVAKPNGSECRLFLLGGEWERKGGAIAYEAMVALNEQGIPATLTVVGCAPPPQERINYQHPGFTTIPYLNMGEPADLARLDELFRTANFFILPSRAECAAIAFADANSFGLPVVTTDVGGISSFVEHGKTGLMLPLSATGTDFAVAIRDLYQDETLYQLMRVAARQRYEATLNWDQWALHLKQELVARDLWPVAELPCP